MNRVLKMVVAAVSLMAVMAGCTYQRGTSLDSVGLPEEIYQTPTRAVHVGSRVAVFNFRGPAYAEEMARSAGESLYQELLKRGVFTEVTYESQWVDLNREAMIAHARAQGYDLIVTGDLLYYFEGSLYYPSRVDQRMEVIDVAEDVILWYAKAVDIGDSAPYKDYLVVEGYGRSAPSGRALLRRNAEKFCELLHQQTVKGLEGMD